MEDAHRLQHEIDVLFALLIDIRKCLGVTIDGNELARDKTIKALYFWFMTR